MDINYLIGLKPETAIAYLKSKGYKISFDWHEVWREAHHKAFTVAKAMDLDILSTIRNSVQTALDSGQSLHQFKETLKPELQKKGWWGKKEMEDPNTGEIKEVMLGSPHRLKTIYQTNLTVAYKVGQYKEQIENAEDRPYWMYEATLDSNTRPEHAALHGKVFRFDDPIWDKIYPPNDWGCRCTVRALKESQLKEKKLEAEKTHYKIPDNFQPKEWAYNPGKEAFAFDADYGKFNQNPSQPNFKDANRPSVKDVEDSYYSDAPEKLPTAKEAGKEKLLELLKKEFDLTKKNYQLIDTADGDKAVFTVDRLKHILDKQDGREQFASFIKPTLTNPYEVYLSEYLSDKGFIEYRKVYIGLFKGETKGSNIFTVLRMEKDSTVFWNMFPQDVRGIDKTRRGKLIFNK